MDEVINLAGTPVFWVCTVLVSLLVNFASQWLYPRIGALPGRLGAWRRRRSTEQQQKFELMVQMLQQHKHMLPIFIAQEARLRTETLEFLALAVLSYSALFGLALSNTWGLIVTILVGASGLFMLLLAKIASGMAGKRQEIIDAIWDRDAAEVVAALQKQTSTGGEPAA